MSRIQLFVVIFSLAGLVGCEDNPHTCCDAGAEHNNASDADGADGADAADATDAPLPPADGSPLDGGDDAAGDADLLTKLRGLPDVISVSLIASDPVLGDFLKVQVRQQIDHLNPEVGTFAQVVDLFVQSADRPVVLATSGYMAANDYCELPIPGANCVVLEHRYFGGSLPSETSYEWLSIAQAAADTHHVIETLREVFSGPWISTGHSKGGMTAVYHRRFFADDVVGTVAFVAPQSTADDPRYPAFLSQVHEEWCRTRIFDLQTEWLLRRASLIPLMGAGSWIPPQRLYEDTVLGFDFQFFQYHSPSSECAALPDASDDDATLFSQLGTMGAEARASIYRAYYVQAATELGWPGGSPKFDQLLSPDRQPWQAVYLPGIDVVYDPKPLEDIGRWVQNQAERIIFIYGELDPWTAGAFDLGQNSNVYRFDVPGGNHGSAIEALPADDGARVQLLIDSWLGLTTRVATLRSRTTVSPHVERVRQSMRLLPL